MRVGLAIALFFAATRTSVAAEDSQATPPEFSHAAGFFTHDLTLSLRAEAGAVIRFTLDGSEPSEASAKYDAPISLTNRTAAPNKLSSIPTVPGFQPPRGNVFKGTVVRARSFVGQKLPSTIVSQSFFIHPQGHSKYTTPVVSLGTDAANFFDPGKGIYVVGRAAGGNYLQKGPGWERPVHVEFFETNGLIAFSQQSGIKIHGNTSPQFPIKGLDLNAEYVDSNGRFRYPIFPDRNRREFDHVLLRPSGHDHHLAFMRDELTQNLAEEFPAETQASRLAVVFLNGEYWGLHYLKEKENAAFVPIIVGFLKPRSTI